jgi:hypothetical protein
MLKIPDWLKKILDDSGLDQGKYSFGEEVMELAGLPAEFSGIAESEGGGLALSTKNDGVIYRFENGKVDVYAIDEREFLLAIKRDEAWEELSENMPAIRSCWLGIVIKSKSDEGEEITLGFGGTSRDAAMVIQAKMLPEEMLTDALNRELLETLEIKNYQILDVLDDGGEYEDGGELMPLFTVVVEVEVFDPDIIGDPRIGWIKMDKQKVLN